MADHKHVIVRSVYKLLQPVVRILLRNGMPFKEFAEIAKQVYVDVATRDFAISGRKQTNSRIAILTGLTRKEVLRLNRIPEPLEAVAAQEYNRAARVVGGWINDEDFQNKQGEPAEISLEGKSGSFEQLVKRYSGDMPPRAIKDELVRVGAISELEDGKLKLNAKAYVPKTGEREKLAILGMSASDILNTIDYNLLNPDDSRFQLSVAYDNLPVEVLEKFKQLSSQEALALLQKLDGYLSKHDRDTSAENTGSGRMRAGMGIYYFEEPVRDEEGSEK